MTDLALSAPEHRPYDNRVSLTAEELEALADDVAGPWVEDLAALNPAKPAG
jgi:hypothetical protein